jgi:hypothetical protein
VGVCRSLACGNGAYLCCFDFEELRPALGDNLTTLPLREMYTGNPRRTCSSMAFATATLKAISARFSSGNRNISFEGLLISHRMGRSWMNDL